MLEHLFRHFSSPGHNGFLADVSITFIYKTDLSDPFKWEDYWRRTLKNMVPFEFNIEDSFWSVIMVMNDSAIINIYLEFRSRYCLLLWNTIFGYWIYLLTIFIVVTLRGMLNFLMWSGFLLADSFHRFSGFSCEKTQGLHEISFCVYLLFVCVFAFYLL